MTARRADKKDETKADGVGGAAGSTAPKPQEDEEYKSLYVQIADRAYYIWLERGKPEHGAWDFWFQAEAEVIREHVDRRARRGT